MKDLYDGLTIEEILRTLQSQPCKIVCAEERLSYDYLKGFYDAITAVMKNDGS